MDEKATLYFIGDSSSFAEFNLTFSRYYKISTVLPEDRNEILVLVLDYEDLSSADRFLGGSIVSYHNSINIVISSDFARVNYSVYKDNVSSYVKRPWDKLILAKVIEQAFFKRSALIERLNLLTRLKNKDKVIEDLNKKLFHNNDNYFSYHILIKGFAHEIKNQLNAISYLDCIFKDLDDRERTYIKSVYKSRDIIVALVNEFSSLSGNRDIVYNRQPHSIVSLINEFVSLIKMDPRISPININIKVDKDYSVMMNKIKITQVLINLVRNSSHSINSLLKKVLSRSRNRSYRVPSFYDDKYITIKVLRRGDFAEISVIDNGRGIDKGHINKVWDSSFSTKGRLGRGLGLSVCRKIVVEGHHGNMYCFSEPYKRTIFSFTLPLAPVIVSVNREASLKL